MKIGSAGAAALLVLCGSAHAAAQEAATPVPLVETAAACCTIPALTPVEIEIAEQMNSKTSRTGASFPIRLAEPLVVDGRVVAPAGTPGAGEVVHAAKARAMGKAGELILAVRYLEIGGQRVPLRSLRYGASQGKDNSGAVATGNMIAAAVLPVASVAAFLIQGGEVNIPAGTRANARVSAATTIAPVQ